jgi:hypothetical protein
MAGQLLFSVKSDALKIALSPGTAARAIVTLLMGLAEVFVSVKVCAALDPPTSSSQNVYAGPIGHPAGALAKETEMLLVEPAAEAVPTGFRGAAANAA